MNTQNFIQLWNQTDTHFRCQTIAKFSLIAITYCGIVLKTMSFIGVL